ncbi:hypothetical protein B0H16DRAFT_1384336 [Mycena metata]|uniref:Protein kinase domain-containing protein n=1 Tax=Mycena metata TaxID=1033252 RepID=A0AAD7HPF7_9AGAR|nr:hypothetical protein B0H16DRAFT_1384336 [Mycena metata]
MTSSLSPASGTAQQLPPAAGSDDFSLSSTPRKAKASGPSAHAITNNSEDRRADAPRANRAWDKTLHENFCGIVSIEDFFTKYMQDTVPPSEIDTDMTECDAALEKAKVAAEKAWRSGKENDMAPAFIEYLEEIVGQLEENRQPFIADTHNTAFQSLDAGDHYTKPDITCSRPGTTTAPKAWADAGTVIELKHKTDIFKGGKINDSLESRHALVQLAKSARSLLMALNACHVFVLSVFGNAMARIFRFDHSGFRATTAFHWTIDKTVFPRFLSRLYPSNVPIGRMHGHDDTISVPTEEEKKEMYKITRKHDYYRRLFKSQESATKESLWVAAVRFRDDNGERVPEPVRCFTIGPALWISDGLFSRATQVYRVILKEDLHMSLPPVYALKDSWRQACRRPESDFYDIIESDKIDSIAAKCHGYLDLSLGSIPTSNPSLHQTSSTPTQDQNLERCHTRCLLTPVGTPLKTFTSTKMLAIALRDAVAQHQAAYEAGVLHRDLSEGNLLFGEGGDEDPQGFLFDYDYAALTDRGFMKWLSSAGKTSPDDVEDVEKTLKDMTGTLPFMAIEVIDNPAVPHGPHHDLESVYWLLFWMILRHVPHTHGKKTLACSHVFDASGSDMKLAQLVKLTPVDQVHPLFRLCEGLRKLVLAQYPPEDDENPPERTLLTHNAVLTVFERSLQTEGWPLADGALDFVLPSQNSEKNPDRNEEDEHVPSQSLKRLHDSGSDSEEELQQENIDDGMLLPSGMQLRTRKRAKKA